MVQILNVYSVQKKQPLKNIFITFKTTVDELITMMKKNCDQYFFLLRFVLSCLLDIFFPKITVIQCHRNDNNKKKQKNIYLYLISTILYDYGYIILNHKKVWYLRNNYIDFI